jgi:serine/threonine protein kinase
MAPEVLAMATSDPAAKGPERRETIKSDVFSAGCVFFYLLTEGQHPFGDTDVDTPTNILNDNPVNFHSKPELHSSIIVYLEQYSLPKDSFCIRIA